MKTNFRKATSVSANFGYSTLMVGNTTVYTTKIRTKQLGLLRYAIEHYRRNTSMLQGIIGQLKMDRKGNRNVTYEFVTTDANKAYLIRQEFDRARAEVLEVQKDRLLRGDYSYMPLWMMNIQEDIMREERNSLGDPLGITYGCDDLDLPF
jgi:hypothetical protein